MKATLPKSTGRAGEQVARYAFKRLGWKMDKVEASVRCHQCGAHNRVAHNGLADFIGRRLSDGQYVACEVKEADCDSLPHSRLSGEQQEFMEDLPHGFRFVGVLWRDGSFEIFDYREGRGSYKKGEGIR